MAMTTLEGLLHIIRHLCPEVDSEWVIHLLSTPAGEFAGVRFVGRPAEISGDRRLQPLREFLVERENGEVAVWSRAGSLPSTDHPGGTHYQTPFLTHGNQDFSDGLQQPPISISEKER